MYKKICFVIFLLSSSFAAMSQEQYSSTGKPEVAIRCPKAYIGFSTGLENPGGLLGINIDVPVIKDISVNAGVGLSSWGTKVYGEARYYLNPCHRGWAFGLGVTHNTGFEDFTVTMSTVAGRRDVTLDLHAATNIYLGVYHFWRLGKRGNRFNITTGYSVPLSSNNYTQTAGPAINQDGRTAMKILAPGGLMLGVGFSFGIYAR